MKDADVYKYHNITMINYICAFVLAFLLHPIFLSLCILISCNVFIQMMILFDKSIS